MRKTMIPMPPRICMRVDRIRHMLTYYHFLMNGNGCYSKCHHHQYHHYSVYIYFLYHLKDSSSSKKSGCYLVTRQGNFNLFPFGSNHLAFSRGRVIELLTYTPESLSSDCQTGRNSSLDRPIHMHRSLQIGLCWRKGLYNSTSQFLQGSSSGESTFNMKHHKLLTIYVYLLFLWYRFPKIMCLNFFCISRDAENWNLLSGFSDTQWGAPLNVYPNLVGSSRVWGFSDNTKELLILL